jgi:hypothetical protein
VTDSPGLTSPLMRVTAPDLTTFEVQATNADLVAYDMTAYKHKWPPMDRAPMLWATFLAWHASRRTGAIGLDLTFEAFRDTYPGIEAVTDADDAVDPTQLAAVPDY